MVEEAQFGIIFSEVMPWTFCAKFVDFDKEAGNNADQAKHYLETLQKLIAERPGKKINIINDTRLISDRVLSLSGEARASYLEAYKLPEIERVAMVGFGPWLRNFIHVLAKFASRSSQTKFFDTPEEAIEWLWAHKK